MSGPAPESGDEPIIDALPARRPTVEDAPHRLHPLSWLFTLLSRLKVIIVPVIIVVVLRQGGGDARGGWLEDPIIWAPLLGGSGIGLAALWQFLTYRYGIGEDALVIRSGLLERNLRVIPFRRIHNVGIEQTLLHRLFRVATVRLESAGSEKPEAEMEVLALEDARAIEALIRRRAQAQRSVAAATDPTVELPADAEAASPAEVPAAGDKTLYAMTLRETLLLGLLSHRGFVAVGAAFGALAYLPGDHLSRLIPQAADRITDQLEVGWLVLLVNALQVAVSAYLAVKLLSIIVTLVQEHRFRLTQDAQRLTTEKGLLSIIRASVSKRRIQSWSRRATLLQRMLGRSALSIDIASRQSGEDSRHSVDALIPMGPHEACDALVDHLLPGAGFSALSYQAVPRTHWWRRAIGGLTFGLFVFGVLLWIAIVWDVSFLWPLLSLLLLPYELYRASREARFAAWALNPRLIAIRSGWPTELTRFAELDTLQVFSLRRSLLDRWFGTATLWIDTAGVAPGTGLHLRYLPIQDAQTLYRHLAAEVAKRPLRW